ncbi:MAG: HNH endonuclease [Reyranella sp.]|nr:HNH endonuclease [Reyranella sp.]
MHDTNSFARMPALDSLAEQPLLSDMLSSFEKECETTFKEESYLVRDNGAVLRRPRFQGRRRKLDRVWTFGSLNRHSGYLEINGHVVHRIVATAFHGPRPSTDHVVDHIDTNRQNNRADNLRWVTRLENILLNPITRARIMLAYGSLDAFFENPGACSIPNWDWMRIVTKEQAEESRKRLLQWAERGQASRGGSLGDWLYQPKPKTLAGRGVNVRRTDFVREALPESGPLDTPSLTTGAVQRNWRTPSEFPQCPETVSPETLNAYREWLAPGVVFARNRYGESIVAEAGISDGVLSVVCNAPSGVKDWTHAKVTVHGEAFVHESGGTFFTREGAMKAHCITLGLPSEAYEGSIDDFC